MGDLFPRDLAKLLWAFGIVSVAPRAFLAAAEPLIAEHLSKFDHNVRGRAGAAQGQSGSRQLNSTCGALGLAEAA